MLILGGDFRTGISTPGNPTANTTIPGVYFQSRGVGGHPTQEIEFLGLVTNSLSMELSLLGEELRQIKGEAARLLSQQLVSARALS